MGLSLFQGMNIFFKYDSFQGQYVNTLNYQLHDTEATLHISQPQQEETGNCGGKEYKFCQFQFIVTISACNIHRSKEWHEVIRHNPNTAVVQHTSTALHHKSVVQHTSKALNHISVNTFSYSSAVCSYCGKYKQLGVQRIWKCCILGEDRTECALIKGKTNLNCRSQTGVLKPALSSGRMAEIQNWVKMIAIVLVSEYHRWKCKCFQGTTAAAAGTKFNRN